MWALHAHILAVANVTGGVYAKANAFVTPLGIDASLDAYAVAHAVLEQGRHFGLVLTRAGIDELAAEAARIWTETAAEAGVRRSA